MALNLIKYAQQCCSLHTSTAHAAKPAAFMKKIMKNSSKKKPLYKTAPTLPTATALTKGSQEGRYSGNSKRARVLNKLFMKHITDLMATGENCHQFIGHGIEINRVEIAPDFAALNVFWVAKGDQSDEITENVLKTNAGFLRHELSTLRLMGEIPLIKFVKDKHYAKLIELDIRLSQADFGPDYVPIAPEERLKTKLELVAPLPTAVKQQILQLEAEFPDDDDEPLPEMPQDVLGLNHAHILARVKQAMKKSAATHRQQADFAPQNTQVNVEPIEYASNAEKRAAFREFLQRRELERSKLRTTDKNYIPDVAYMREEYAERQRQFFDQMLDTFEDKDLRGNDDDYVDDDLR